MYSNCKHIKLNLIVVTSFLWNGLEKLFNTFDFVRMAFIGEDEPKHMSSMSIFPKNNTKWAIMFSQIPVSQLVPVELVTHEHVYWFTKSVQFPLLLQGFDRHSFISAVDVIRGYYTVRLDIAVTIMKRKTKKWQKTMSWTNKIYVVCRVNFCTRTHGFHFVKQCNSFLLIIE